MFPVLAAAHKALLSKSRESLTTRTLHSELVYNCSGSKHVGYSSCYFFFSFQRISFITLDVLDLILHEDGTVLARCGDSLLGFVFLR